MIPLWHGEGHARVSSGGKGYPMLRTRLAVARLGVATLLAGSLLSMSAGLASADNEDQKGKGKNAPEVPATAQLPVVAALGGVTFFVLSRGLRRKAVAATTEAGAE